MHYPFMVRGLENSGFGNAGIDEHKVVYILRKISQAWITENRFGELIMIKEAKSELPGVRKA